MNKKYLAAAAFFVAGTAFANAEEFIWIPTSEQKTTTLSEIDTTKEFSITLEYNLDTALTGTGKSDFFSLSFSGSISDNTKDSLVFRRTPANAQRIVINGKGGQNFTFADLGASSTSAGSHILKIIFGGSEKTASYELDGAVGSIPSLSAFNFTLEEEGNIGLFVGGEIEFSKVKLNYAVSPSVPEPSAFGLLAGAGALALVAARRRRKRA